VTSVYQGPWRVDVERRDGVSSPLSAARIGRTVAHTLDAAGAPPPASLTVVLSDDEELADLNREHMGEQGPTDVLSFPMLPPGAFPPHPGQADDEGSAFETDLPQPARGRRHLGDIVISVERAIAQAEQGRGGHDGNVRWSVADELRLLLIHGTLHVCGWDHGDPDEREAMRALEKDLLAET
jgi:probable rRNA maturation factor